MTEWWSTKMETENSESDQKDKGKGRREQGKLHARACDFSERASARARYLDSLSI